MNQIYANEIHLPQMRTLVHLGSAEYDFMCATFYRMMQLDGTIYCPTHHSVWTKATKTSHSLLSKCTDHVTKLSIPWDPQNQHPAFLDFLAKYVEVTVTPTQVSVPRIFFNSEIYGAASVYHTKVSNFISEQKELEEQFNHSNFTRNVYTYL